MTYKSNYNELHMSKKLVSQKQSSKAFYKISIFQISPVDYFQCVTIMRKTNNDVTFYGRLKNS